MRSGASLFSRGIIMMAFPIVCQLIFIVVIAGVMRQAQETLEKQWREENLLRLTFSICREVSDVLLWLQLPPYFRDKIGLDVSSSWLIRAEKESEMLRQLGADDPAKQDALNRMIKSKAYLFGLLEQMMSKSSETYVTPFGFGPGPAYRKGIKVSGRVFYTSVEDIVAIEKKKEANEDAYAVAFSRVRYGLLFAAAVVFVLAACAGYVYVISIKRPLKHLSDNGQLLAAQHPLLPPLESRDEFAKIDNLLHTADLEVRRIAEKEKEVIENAQDMIGIIDENGNFLSVNPFVERMLGRLPDDLINRPVSELAIFADGKQAAERILSSVGSTAICQFELQLLHADGSTVETRWSCLWSAAEKKVFCVVRDVSEEKRIEQLKQDFADMISHDLRSPLMAMGNSLTLIKAGVKGEVPPDAMPRVETAARNLEKLIVLVNDLLDFQKLKAGKMELVLEETALEVIIKDAADLLEEGARSKGVALQLPEGQTLVFLDKNKVIQVAVNLISNAIKFSGEGGTVVVSVEKDSKNVSFSVSDTGPGISPEFYKRIFEPFEQAPSDKKKEGTGLGLAICKLVVEAHGGSISAKNRNDEKSGGSWKSDTGSVFTVVLPLDRSS